MGFDYAASAQLPDRTPRWRGPVGAAEATGTWSPADFDTAIRTFSSPTPRSRTMKPSV